MTDSNWVVRRKQDRLFQKRQSQVHHRQPLQVIGALLGAAFLLFTQQQANAASLGWNYVLDSFNDGHDRSNIPGPSFVVGSNSAFELAGISWAQDNDKFYFAFKGNAPLQGVSSSYAADGNISYGDFLLNFTGKSFAEANGSLIGVRFAPNNNAGVSGTGVWSQVTAIAVAAANDGFSSLNAYEQAVTKLGGTPSLGGLPANTTYFDRTSVLPTVIGSGTKQGDITALDRATLAMLGWTDQSGSVGQHIYGFSFDKAYLPTGSFVGSLGFECLNDLVAFEGKVDAAAVPEPTTMAGLAFAGVAGAYMKRRQKQSSKDA